MIAGNGICLIVLAAENATRSNMLISPSVVCRLWSVVAFLPKIFSSVSRSLMTWSWLNCAFAQRMKSCWRALRTMSLSVWRKRTNDSASAPHSFWYPG